MWPFNNSENCFICSEKYKRMISLQECLDEFKRLTVAQILQNLHFSTISDPTMLQGTVCLICIAKIQSCYEFKTLFDKIDKALKSTIHNKIFVSPTDSTSIPDPLLIPFTNIKQEENQLQQPSEGTLIEIVNEMETQIPKEEIIVTEHRIATEDIVTKQPTLKDHSYDNFGITEAVFQSKEGNGENQRKQNNDQRLNFSTQMTSSTSECNQGPVEMLTEDEIYATTRDQHIVTSQEHHSSTAALKEQPTISSANEDIQLPHPNSSSSSLAPQKNITSKNKKPLCLFCDNAEKKVGQKRSYVSFPRSEATVNAIRVMAEKYDDWKLLEKLNSNLKVAYHSNCFSLYQLAVKRKEKERPEPTEWHKNRQLHQLAFDALSEIIKVDIIGKNRIMYLTDLISQYKSLLFEFGEGQLRAEDLQEYRAENLESKIVKAFGDRLTIECYIGKKKIVYQNDMDPVLLASEIVMIKLKTKNRRKDVAYELRNSITTLQSTTLPETNITVQDIIRGECKIPEELFSFVCDLVQGPDLRRKNSSDDLVKIKSVCSDLIYIVTKGRIKPSKHLALAVSVKSIRSSREVLTMLNRYGHTIGYPLAEEIETKMTYTSQEDKKNILSGIHKVNGLTTQVAVDNFDRFIDTPTEKDTLDDAVGINYPFRCEIKEESGSDLSSDLGSDSHNVHEEGLPTKRRCYKAPSHDGNDI